MKIHNCKIGMSRHEKTLLKEWAKRLDADEIIIHMDGSVTLKRGAEYM